MAAWSDRGFCRSRTPRRPSCRSAGLLRLSLFQVSVGMAGAAHRHAQPGHDRRARRAGVARGADGLAAAGVRAVARADRLPLRYTPFAPRLAAGALHLDRHAAAVRRPRDHAVRAARALRAKAHGPCGSARSAPRWRSCWSGAGMHTTQTAGPRARHRLAPAESRPRVVALLYVMLLVGMVVSALVFGALLADFRQLRLIQVIQGAAVVTMVLNVLALWKQEARDPTRAPHGARARRSARPGARSATAVGRRRLLVAVGLGTAGFTMQDILLEPYGGEILRLSVGATTTLTAMLATGTLVAFALAARASSAAPIRTGWPRSVRSPASWHSLLSFSRTAGIATVVPCRHRPDRLRRRAVRRRHADSGDGARRRTAKAVSRSAHGAPCRRPPPASPSQSAGRFATSCPPSASGALGPHSPDRQSASGWSTASRSCCCSHLVAIGPLVRRRAGPTRPLGAQVRSCRVPRLEQRRSMPSGAITSYIDVAQLVLYAFWIFFAGLIIYLRREDKREGYPLESDRTGGRIDVQGFPAFPRPRRSCCARRTRRCQVARPTSAPASPRRSRAFRCSAGAYRGSHAGRGRTGRYATRRYARSDDRRRPKIVPLRVAADRFSSRAIPIRAACRSSAPTTPSPAWSGTSGSTSRKSSDISRCNLRVSEGTVASGKFLSHRQLGAGCSRSLAKQFANVPAGKPGSGDLSGRGSDHRFLWRRQALRQAAAPGAVAVRTIS